MCGHALIFNDSRQVCLFACAGGEILECQARDILDAFRADKNPRGIQAETRADWKTAQQKGKSGLFLVVRDQAAPEKKRTPSLSPL